MIRRRHLPKKPAHHRLKKEDLEFSHVHLQEDGVVRDGDEAEDAKAEHDIEKGLKAIYGEETDDLHVVEEDKNWLTRFLIKTIIILLCLTAVGYGGFFAYSNFFKDPGGDPLVVRIEAPTEAKSGSEVKLVVHYENPRNLPLAQLAVDVNLPSGFVLSSAMPQPTNVEELIWQIGSLGQHSDGKIELTGYWFASVPSTGSIQAVATYRPANFNSDFSYIATSSLAVNEGVVGLKVEGPAEAIPGEEVTYAFTVTNTTDRQLSGFETSFSLPSTFIVGSFTPALEPGGVLVWKVAALEAGAETKMVLKGSYASDAEDIQEVKADVAIVPAEGRIPLTQATGSWFTDVKGGDIRLSLAANGSTTAASVTPGGQLRLTAQIANEGQTPIADASVVLDFQPESGVPINWSGSTLGAGQVTSQGVVLSAKAIGTIAPGERKSFSFIFPIKTEVSASTASSFTVQAKATSANGSVQSTPVTVALNASTSISAEGRYYDEGGAPVGSGPFPPKVGQESTYRIDWKLTRQLHALEDVTLSATLPQTVKFAGAGTAEQGSVSYDESSRTVRWTIDLVGDDVSDAMASFFVSVTPGEGDIDKYLKLLSATALRATDSVTDAAIAAQAGEVTTEFPADETAAGRGIVQD